MEALYIIIGAIAGASIIYLLKEKQLAIQKKENQHLKENHKTYKQELQQQQQNLQTQLENFTNKILEEKTQKITQQNKENIDTILFPLKEKLTNFEQTVKNTHEKNIEHHTSLKEQIKHLSQLNQQVSQEAHNLTTALKGDSKTQGNWGEMILENILEKSGLQKDREYFIQQSHTNENGKRLQPDVIVKYPGERHVIIDSKVSLINYEKYNTATNNEDKQNHLKNHINSIKMHIKQLSSKSYENIPTIKGLDFVMMFIPIEPAYLLAINAESELWNYAYEKRILLISPTNLIASLKMIVSLWKQEQQSQNAKEIAERGGKMYDQFVRFVEDLIKIGKKIDESKTTYQDAMKRLHTGNDNLVKQTEKMKQLGAKAKKQLPENLLKRTQEQEIQLQKNKELQKNKAPY